MLPGSQSGLDRQSMDPSERRPPHITLVGCRMHWLQLNASARLLLLWVAVIAAASGRQIAAGILVDNGRASGCIVLPEGIDDSEPRLWKVSTDLAGYIQRMSGARMRLRWDNEQFEGFRILIGSTRLAPVEPEQVSAEKRHQWLLHTVVAWRRGEERSPLLECQAEHSG